MSTENIVKVITTGVRVGIPAAVVTVAGEIALNQTNMKSGTKSLVMAIGCGALAVGTAKYAPTIAVGAVAAAVVYGSQAASRKARLEQRVSQMLADRRTQQQPTPNTTNTTNTNNTQTRPAAGLPQPNRVQNPYQRTPHYERTG